MDIASWLQRVQGIRNEFDRVLVSESKAEQTLRDLAADLNSPVRAIRFEIARYAPFRTVEIGQRIDSAPSEMRSIPALDSFGTTGKITLWMLDTGAHQSALDSSHMNSLLDGLTEILKLFWRGDLRDTISWLISRQNSERQRLLDHTVLEFSAKGRGLTLFYCDLDNFKAANDSLGHVKGDSIIRDFASVLSACCPPDCIVVHRSGDEFIVISPSAVRHEAIAISRSIHSAVREHDFGTGAIRIDSKIGMAVFPVLDDFRSYDSIESEAEAATLWNSQKQRGRARFAGALPSNLPVISSEAFDIALVLLKANMLSKEPFENPWLNCISAAVVSLPKSELPIQPEATALVVEQALQWIVPAYDDTLITAALSDRSARTMPPVFSHFDVALAVAHACFHRALASSPTIQQNMQLRHGHDGASGSLEVQPDGQILYSWGGPSDSLSSVDLGAFWRAEKLDSLAEECCRCAVLVKVGHQPSTVAAQAFSDVITIDDRPTKGGGLPDFWEATIARLVGHVEANPNIAGLFIAGEPSSAVNSVAKLRAMSSWPVESAKLGARTGMAIESIIAVARRLGGAVTLAESKTKLASELAKLYRQPRTLHPVSVPAVAKIRRFLNRTLDIAPFALHRDDGIRVRSIAEAFPLVLEIARKADVGDRIIDQAGQSLYELVDFKVHLSTPTADMVPSFYAGEEESLREYFERQFVSAEGLFSSLFNSTGQIDAVITHIASSLKTDTPFHTRRGILVIPHEVKSGADLTPLGLVSIRIIPRSVGEKRQLNFSFTWRTVEALVGFPYSVYGSVRYAEYLTKLIRDVLAKTSNKTVELGYLNYIAHSLHFFLDAYAQNIARRIVDDASA